MEIGRGIRETAGTLIGWRAWVVTETAAGLRLASVLHDVVWEIATPALAACRRDEDPFAERQPEHPVPGLACNCGFHAARDPVEALSYLRGRDEPGTVCRVLGEVSLWGHLVQTESGWRASHAYPARLYVNDPVVAAALAAYGVPVVSPAWTSSTAASAGSPTSFWNAARTRSSLTAASG